MLAIGSQLYNLTDRDRATLLLEPFIRAISQTWAIGVAQDTVTITWPADRMLWLQNLNVDWNCGAAASRANMLLAYWQESPGAAGLYIHHERGGNLLSEGTGAAQQNASRSLHSLGLLLPAGQLSIRMTRTDTTVAGAIAPYVHGYLIPPGGIGRSA